MVKRKVYFKGLHALRFFAALIVLISHMEMIKRWLYTPSIYNKDIWLSGALANLGPMGVTFFFVLSGFLITYLIMEEKIATNKINIKKFYLRRILRIWPIYLLFTFLAFFIFPQFELFYLNHFTNKLDDNFFEKIVMYILFIPGFALALYRGVPWAGHLWSVGVEEQFYLIWPKAMQSFKPSNKWFVILIGVVLGIKAIFLILYSNGACPLWVKEVIAQSKFECMIIGGWGAFSYRYNEEKIKRIFSKSFIIPVSIALSFGVTWFLPEVINDLKHVIVSPFFLLLILGVIISNSTKWMDAKPFIFLGNISYGFYIYHMVCSAVIIRLMIWLTPDIMSSNTFIMNTIVYVGSTLFTIGVSALSYKLIETPFLKLKTKFAVVKSGKA